MFRLGTGEEGGEYGAGMGAERMIGAAEGVGDAVEDLDRDDDAAQKGAAVRNPARLRLAVVLKPACLDAAPERDLGDEGVDEEVEGAGLGQEEGQDGEDGREEKYEPCHGCTRREERAHESVDALTVEQIQPRDALLVPLLELLKSARLRNRSPSSRHTFSLSLLSLLIASHHGGVVREAGTGRRSTEGCAEAGSVS